MLKKRNKVERYYDLEDLKKEGKIACNDCIYVTGEHNEGCTMAYAVNLQPEDCYWTFGGSIIGCKHGDRKDDRIE